MEEEKILGKINVTITDRDILYDTEFEVDQVLFWLEVTKASILKKLLEMPNE